MNKNKRWLLQHTNFQTVTRQSKRLNGHCLSPWEHWFCKFSVFIHHNLQTNYHCSNLMKAIIYWLATLIPEDHRTFSDTPLGFNLKWFSITFLIFLLQTLMTSFLLRRLKRCLLDKTGIQRLAQKLLMEEEPHPPSSHSCPIKSSKTSIFLNVYLWNNCTFACWLCNFILTMGSTKNRFPWGKQSPQIPIPWIAEKKQFLFPAKKIKFAMK